ncbi:MAG TPA: SDR family oxidoreductase [SAR86 cluster bacterium]|jgi:NAD(P)-dependent dehydrogenase (short-subunit alcohol dehydrogenase family)|nr:SDR family oxidoreductase [SAR86 cluster bacterium]HJM14880.1 SDR family oxidoreductase [SAR86 cluster bacterium]
MKHVKNLKIVITAGASGIGSEIAMILSQADAKVIICDKDQEVLDQFSKNNPEIITLKADVSREEEVASFFNEIKDHFGEINALINNAGIAGPSAKLEDTNFNDWKNTLSVNLNGTFLSTKSAIPLLRSAGGGSIINIGSTSSFMGTPLRSSYSATKWGLIGLTKTWAMEYGEDNIRINTICPSSVNGERIEQVIEREAKYRSVSPEEIKAAYLSQTSMKTFIDAEEIAGMIVYLLSPLARKITGQMLAIDGHTESLSMINKEDD